MDLSPFSDPRDALEACAMVRRAVQEHVALVPVGNGTRRDWGNCTDAGAVPLRTVRLASIVDYDPANQVVVAGAGLSLGSLQEALAEHGQWLALRPPGGGRHTLGGLAALGLCGPERLRYGAPRDLLLGLKFVSAAGALIAAGGRVVKNVAGYDMTRLLVGSGGTLGLITELTFRLHPLPERCAGLVAAGTLAQCAVAAAKLRRSKLEPNLLVAVPEPRGLSPRPEMRGGEPRGSAGGETWRLMAGFEGFDQTVGFQLEGARAIAAELGLGDPEHRAYSPREGICGPLFDAVEQAPFVLRADLPPDQVAAFAAGVRETLPEAILLVDFGCGRVTLGASELTEGAWARCGALAREGQGHAVLEKAPADFARGHDLFGVSRGDGALVHRVKAALDPHNIFAPGRLPGKKQ